MEKTVWVLMAVLALAGCGQDETAEVPQRPAEQATVAAAPIDYQHMVLMTIAAVSRSMELFSRLGNSDMYVYNREIYNPVAELAAAWPVYYAPEGKNVPEALWDCREAVVTWTAYLDRATMKNPPDFVVRDAKKDLVKAQQKLNRCNASLGV